METTVITSLRERLTAYGFESNDDYAFQLRCLLGGPCTGLRTLDIAGDGGRRKTAFANALARALDISQILYHDFTDQPPPAPEAILPPSRDELGRVAMPVEPLDDVISEACAQSEANPTVLILDQLQAADFREHLRIQRLIADACWHMHDARYYANRRNLLVFLIGEEPLYHALQKLSFRVWIGRICERQMEYHPEDFGLGAEAAPLFEALSTLFHALGMAPTPSELTNLLSDIRSHVQNIEHLSLSLYGRTEGLEHTTLLDPALNQPLAQVLAAAQALADSESVELPADTPHGHA